VLECDSGAEGEYADSCLRLFLEPQFAPVRLQSLILEEPDEPFDVPAAAALISRHTSLTRLSLFSFPLDSDVALAAVVDLAISQLQELSMYDCQLSPVWLPALTRLLDRGSLTLLRLQSVELLFVGASAPAFCAALRASRLVSLALLNMRLWESLEDGLTVVAACTNHPTLRELDLRRNHRNLKTLPDIVAALDALEASSPKLRLTR